MILSQIQNGWGSLPRVISIVGGGGKTTLMNKLAAELAAEGNAVLMTTTTHLAWPPERVHFVAGDSTEAVNRAAAAGEVVLTGLQCSERRMMGPVCCLSEFSAYDYILCEADGSNRRPLKVHNQQEPVIPPETDLVIQVAGLSSLGTPIGQSVHRFSLMDLDETKTVDGDTILQILLRGWTRCGESGLTLLNQADNDAVQLQGKQIATELERRGYPTVVAALNPPQQGAE